MAAQKHPMETYHGIVRTPSDAIKLFEACRLGLLPRVQRRLSEKERQAIRSGSVFVWDEREAGMRRWTDGKSWSASRVSGSFLTYREMEGKRGSGFNTMRRVSGKTPDSSGRGSDEDQDDGEPDGYRYKADGLMKQSFSITTSNGQHLHLISYYARPAPGEPELPHPATDTTLRSVIPVKGMYPESSMSDNTPIPAVTRVPMNQQPQQHHYHPPPPYSGPPPQLGPGPGHHQPYQPYGQQQGYSWPPSPIATPPYSHYVTASAPYAQQQPHQSQHHGQGQQLSHTPPPPPSSSYYASHQQGPLSHSLPPYNGPPPPQYDHRMPLPPPQVTGPGISRITPPYGQQPPLGAGGVGPHHISRSPGSVYRQSLPALPPVSSASSATSTSSAVYGASPGSRNNLPPVSLSLPALSATIAAPASGLPPSQTPPRRLSPSPTNGHSYPKPLQSADPYGNGGSSSFGANGSNKASLSALLHPAQSPSEASGAPATGTNSASNSPRRGIPPPIVTSPPGSGGASVSGANGAPLAMVPQQFLQPAPSGEDTRALSRLDRKFCI